MSVIMSATVTFTSFILVVNHLPKHWMLRVAGRKGLADLFIHGTILYIFLGTSTEGLIQAEFAGIMFSLYIRAYRYLKGYEVRQGGKWIRYAGQMT